MKVSVLILTFNEARNLGRCLSALAWCDDIIIIDSGSTDGTLEIAAKASARVLHRPFDDFASQRNFGLMKGAPRHQWVLHLDADEVITEQFRLRLEKLEPQPGIDAFKVPSKLMLYDRWLRYSGMYPTYQVRLGHRDRLRFRQVGHGQREDLPPERIGTFDEPYLHYSFSHGLVAWLQKHVKYAKHEAQQLVRGRCHGGSGDVLSKDPMSRRRAAKRLAGRLPLIVRPIARFFYVLIWRRGFLDGRYGVLYALMLSVYEGMIAILAADEFLRHRSATHANVGPKAGKAAVQHPPN